MGHNTGIHTTLHDVSAVFLAAISDNVGSNTTGSGQSLWMDVLYPGTREYTRQAPPQKEPLNHMILKNHPKSG